MVGAIPGANIKNGKRETILIKALRRSLRYTAPQGGVRKVRCQDLAGSRPAPLWVKEKTDDPDYAIPILGGQHLVTDWEGFINGLGDINYQGTLCFEVFRVNDVFPRELWDHVFRLISATGIYFVKRIEAEQ